MTKWSIGAHSQLRHSVTSSLRHFRTAFTLIEVLTTVALLIIILGLMVSLARGVRNTSATQITRQLLVELDTVLAQYANVKDADLAKVPPLVSVASGELPDEETLLRNALSNNEAFVHWLKNQPGATSSGLFAKLPISIYDQAALRDAWGTPLVFMSRGRSGIGMAPDDRGFIFSAGPDRQYRTRQDNLYSYEGR